MVVRIQRAVFDPGAETNTFLRSAAGAGAAVTFTGLVRSTPAEPIVSLTLECYMELAHRQINAMVEVAVARFALSAAAVIHRYGTLAPGEAIVQVMALASHRAAAFAGAAFIMDSLKTDAPFWKKERTPSGERWVATRDTDAEAAARWAD